MSWFSNQWNRFNQSLNGETGRDGAQQSSVVRRVEVVWGRERMQIVLPRLTTPTTLGHLKQEISSITSIPYEQVKLIHSGLILKDDRSALSAYGIMDGSRVILVGTAGGVPQEGDKVGAKNPATGALSVGEQKARAKKQKEQDTSEEGLLARIEEAVSEARQTLFPEVVLLEKSVKALGTQATDGDATAAATPIPTTATATATPTANSSAPSSTASPTAGPAAPTGSVTAADRPSACNVMTPIEIANTHRKTSEMLLRQLLALDGVQVNSEKTRAARKEGVREVQSHLDRLDAAWTEAKAKGVKPPA